MNIKNHDIQPLVPGKLYKVVCKDPMSARGFPINDGLSMGKVLVRPGEIILYLGVSPGPSLIYTKQLKRHRFIRGLDGRIYLFFDDWYDILNKTPEEYLECLTPPR